MSLHEKERLWLLNSPVTVDPDSPRIKLSHGEGGKLMRSLIREHVLAHLGGEPSSLEDSFHTAKVDGRLAMTSDSYVVSPLFFPGGDIGSLAVYGTVNDLAVSGARPVYLSLSLIIEEGFPLELLDEILKRVCSASQETNTKIVTGDTKIVPAGAADGIFINTTGIGLLEDPIPQGSQALVAEDEILVTGPIGRHGIAVLCAREELGLTPPPRSDSAPLHRLTRHLQDGIGTHLKTMRDATRGGVAAVLHEWAEASRTTIGLREEDLPISGDVRGASELLGLDPIYIANEGTMVVAVESGFGTAALEILRSLPEGRDAALIGKVKQEGIASVTIERSMGVEQPIDEPLGAPLPRIC